MAFGRLSKSRGGAPRGERIPLDAQPRPKREQSGNIRWRGADNGWCACRRSASLFCLSMILSENR